MKLACSTPIRLAALFALCGLVAALTAPAHAFPLFAPSSAAPAPAPAGIEPYRLAGDDEISITVINWPKFNTDTVVAPDGTINVPLLPAINVTGMTIAEVEKVLTDQWQQYIVNPAVSVSLVHKRPQEDILLYGGLSRVGTVPYTLNLSLLQAIAEMGGASDSGDLAAVTVVRGAQHITVDMSKPNPTQNVVLEPGDVVYVPVVQNEVAVLGEVNKPGNVTFPTGRTDSVLDALTAAGGVTASADLTHAQLTRDGKTIPLNLAALLQKGDMADNFALSAGDRLFVPTNGLQVYVFGDVLHPGFYLMQPGDRVLDALKQAGGTAQDADLGRVVLIHVDKAKNTATVSKINVGNFISKGDLTQNVALLPNDNIYVAVRKKGFSLSSLLGALSSLNVLGTTAMVVKQTGL